MGRSCGVAAVVLVAFSLAELSHSQGTSVQHRRFEYKHSFRAPNLAQRDGSIPFWVVTGDAIASSEQLRLAPSMRSRRGIAWNKRPMTESENFEVDMSFKVTGQGRIGADGLALWYTAQQGSLGPVFGANDYWTGLGLFFDSFDNDAQKNNPYIALMINDGTRSYDHHTDGSQQMLTGCQKDFRNKPFPVRVRVEYLRNVLTVLVHDGMTAQPRYELCLRAENVFLPRAGHFGVSAATGGLADDHDVLDFSVYSLFTDKPAPPVSGAQPLQQEERQKYDAEFEKQLQDYEKERQKFKEQHPDKVKEDEEEDDFAKYYEDATARELRLIYESQTAIHQVLSQMEARLREVQAQQQQQTALLSGGTPAAQQVAQQQAAQGGAQPGVAGAGFAAHEKNEVIQGVRDIATSIRDMKNYVNEIYTRTYNLQQKIEQGQIGGAGGGGGSGSGGVDTQKIDAILSEVRSVRANQINQAGAGAAAGCPNVSCLSSTVFMFIAAVQSIIIIAIIFMRFFLESTGNLFRSKSEKPKFY